MASKDKALVSAQPPDPDRWQLIRDVAVFQVKLVVDGLRDVLLSPASLIAALGDLILGRDRGHDRFYQVVRFGRRMVRNDPKMQKVLDAVQWQADHFEEVPVLVVACLKGFRLPFPPMFASSYFGSIYPSVQNLLLAARAAGLGAALITLPLWSTFAARRILGCPFSVLPCAVIPLGWPRGRYGPTTRKPVEQVVSVDRYGNRAWLANSAR